MNILEQIFKLENPKLEYKIPEEVYNLLFDWFNESNISITTFETEFFEPIIKVFRTLEHENKYFESNFEVVRRGYYLKFAFMYLIGHYPKNDLLKRFFDVKFNNYEDITKWYSHATLAHQNPELFRPLDIGSQIANYYHAIYARIDQNIGYLPCNFAQLKFQNDDAFFNSVFNYVNSQTFEEKPYLLFLLFKSTTLKHNYEIDENGKYIDKGLEVIAVSPYDEQIKIAFENSILEYNQLYKPNLSKELFWVLKEFLAFKQVDKKAKLTIDNFEEAKIIVHRAKGNEIVLLDHFIYYIKNEYLYEQDRYWQILLTAICNDFVCPIDWLEDKIDFLLSKNEMRSSLLINEINNSHLIFRYIITPLLQNSSSNINYSDPIVQKYESLLFKRTKITPYQKGLDILRTIATNTIDNEQECNFILSKLSDFYFELSYTTDYTYISHDDKDKKLTTLKKFIENLNYILPITSIVR